MLSAERNAHGLQFQKLHKILKQKGFPIVVTFFFLFVPYNYVCLVILKYSIYFI